MSELATGVTIGGIIVIIASFVIGNFRGEANKRSEIYKHINKECVKKNVCDERHKPINEKLEEMHGDIKRLLTKNGLK